MVGIFLTTFNFLGKTRGCVASLSRATSYPYMLVVVDNASTDGTCQFLKEKGIEVIGNRSRVHLSVAINQGLRRHLARPEVDFLCWIHNDMRFYRGWLENLVRELRSDPAVGKLAPYNILSEGRTDEGFALQFMEAHRGHKFLGNQCPWIMPRHVVERVGLFDEGYIECGGYEDWDYNNRVIDAGYLVAITAASVVRHEAMGTRRYVSQEAAYHANAQRYLTKWGQSGPRV